MNSIFKLGVAVIIGISCNLFAQQEVVLLEKQMAEVDLTIAELQLQRDALEAEIKTKTPEIQRLRDKSGLNYFQRQRLETLLKEAQERGLQIEKIDKQLSVQRDLRQNISERLIILYERKIQGYLTQLETGRMPPDKQANLLEEVKQLRSKVETLKPYAAAQKSSLHIAPLKMEADDTPKQIALKADLLKDQEEKLRGLAGTYQKQKKDLKQEIEIRNRINELVTDLAVFDPQEEVLTDFSSAEASALPDQFSDESGVRTQENPAGVRAGQKDFDFTSLSTDQIEDIIDQLDNRTKRAITQADSLGRQAESFYKAAEKSKKQ